LWVGQEGEFRFGGSRSRSCEPKQAQGIVRIKESPKEEKTSGGWGRAHTLSPKRWIPLCVGQESKTSKKKFCKRGD